MATKDIHVVPVSKITTKIYQNIPYSERNKKPKCPLRSCTSRMVKLKAFTKGSSSVVGFFCDDCKTVFVVGFYDVFTMRLE